MGTLKFMTWPRWIIVAYALVTIGMGVQAYFFPSDGVAHIASLMGGVGAGVLLLAAVGITLVKPPIGYVIALLICGLLAFQFGSGLMKDNAAGKPLKVYPKLVGTLLAVGVGTTLLAAHFATRAKSAASGS